MTGHLPFTKGQWHLFRGKPDLQVLAEDKIDVLIFYEHNSRERDVNCWEETMPNDVVMRQLRIACGENCCILEMRRLTVWRGPQPATY